MNGPRLSDQKGSRAAKDQSAIVRYNPATSGGKNGGGKPTNSLQHIAGIKPRFPLGLWMGIEPGFDSHFCISHSMPSGPSNSFRLVLSQLSWTHDRCRTIDGRSADMEIGVAMSYRYFIARKQKPFSFVVLRRIDAGHAKALTETLSSHME